MIDEVKVWVLNICAISFSMLEVEWALKIIALLLSVAYTVQRMYITHTKNETKQEPNAIGSKQKSNSKS
jgi:hypothetical protein